MAHHPIGGHTLGSLGQQQVFLGGPATTTRAGLGIHHDAAGLDQSLLEEGGEGQQAGGGETARGRHQARLADPLLLPFHQAIHRLLAKLGIAAGKLTRFGGIHLLPLLQRAVAVVGGEIHHLHTPLQQARHQA